MIFNLQAQTVLLLLRSFLSGCVLSAVYDIFTVMIGNTDTPRRLRKIILSVLLFVCDFCFCLLCGIVSLLLMYYSNGGFFRAIIFPVMLVGFISFRCSLGILWRKLLMLLKKAILKLLMLLSRPMIFIIKKLILLYHLTIHKILDKIKMRIESQKEKRALRSAQAEQTESSIQETEDFVHVGKSAGYRKTGRIKF
ncbi:MAG: hypothetical protein E7667_00555 [Ruminococcaceae bacterium]|nr:hypothetical protein [Oscillospiraceae bacterium]